jgi:predicted nucleotidyltransferase
VRSKVDPSLDAYLDGLVGVLRRRLGDDLVAVALIGGAGAGAFEPAASDIDVAVVVEHPPAAEPLGALAAELSHGRRPVPARRLELVVYTREGLDTGDFELNLNTGADVEDAETEPKPGEGFWFVLDLAIARERSRALVGPPLAELVPPLPRERLAAAALRSLRWLAEHEPDAPDTLLNACRSWRWAAEGVWSTKVEAAEWALARSSDPGLVRAALAERKLGRREGLDVAEVRRVVARAEEALSRLA